MLMTINNNHLLEMFPMLIKYYYKMLRFQYNLARYRRRSDTTPKTEQVFNLFYREVNRQLF